MKGILSLHGEDERYVFQGVHMLFDAKAGTPWEANESRINRLVFIGRDLDREHLNLSFTECLVK
jgi:G3E family GTPase